MFSGIVEKVVPVIDIVFKGTNKIFTLQHDFQEELYIDQSIAHNGVCLTIIELLDNAYKVEAIQETLHRSNLGVIEVGDLLNIERCIKLESRLDGHVVQGHVDGMGELLSINENDGSWDFRFSFSEEHKNLVIEKGSICINGVSLTVYDIRDSSFQVSIIPYTYEHTNFKYLKIGARVNLEYDMIGKYVVRYMQNLKSQ